MNYYNSNYHTQKTVLYFFISYYNGDLYKKCVKLISTHEVRV